MPDITEEFIGLTNCDKKVATKYLKRNNWNLNYALNEYYDKEVGSFLVEEEVIEYPEELIQIFKKYSNDNGESIDTDGFIQLINDLDYQLEDIVTICLAELMHCKSLSLPITKDQFLSTWYEQGCSQLKHMKILLDDLDHKLQNDIRYYTHIYRYSFDLIRDSNEKCIEKDMAIEYWKLFFSSKCPITINELQLNSWIEFINVNEIESITRDVWERLLEYFKKYPTLEILSKNYNELDPWPYIMDEYYEFLEDTKRI
ncbi:hypothetical protein Kpol_1036p68 [Vanderwaltozyma polyspora DSM 70294]|uniref:Defective in cullin neddylation protein n=1 Tax=Vanderwaltozyma polyspora (strain ATCC 22028 / DSM 70294 / BCRC 21397 / CBS 2163 / NBRC 10782 / NRRL Y-8283 / UCD 57-17) TaxID=436907 RepID=A7TEL5_VANPO|nr:uncharacterized protein Kpol_1036p68 [Vanderwaltozyma polyspora DSM 70294]EDO19322.1 hypothetical protein Kpol_1036p68 [Vanderwaltozyma polyspora DSM 70294]